jgi:glycosyltransferase involved in cell wall biosynthesis
MTSPLVSVVLPTRNRANLLRRSIASVFGQTYQNLELIVINDGSTDNTLEILSAVNDSRLRVLNREINQGAAAARNAGINAARGEFIAFQDDDDVWLMQKLERQMAALLNGGPHLGWCICANIRIAENECMYIGGEFHRNQMDFNQGIGPPGHDWGLIATPGWVVRREWLARAGSFDERILSWEDWELGIRLSKEGGFVFIDEPLWIQDWVYGKGLTKDRHIRAKGLQVIMEKHGHMWRSRPDVLARHFYYIGRMLNLYNGPPVGRDYLFRSLGFAPLRFETWVAIMLSYLKREWMTGATLLIQKLRGLIK